MRISVQAILLLLISGCATQTGFYSGENLLQPMPIPEDSWEIYEKKEGNIYTRMWSKNNHRTNLTVNTTKNTDGIIFTQKHAVTGEEREG